MNVFLTDAAGYIGLNVAIAFCRAGYQVYGLIQNPEEATILERNEIIPVNGALQEFDCFKNVAVDSDVIVHAAMDYKDDTAKLDTETTKALLDLSKNSSRQKTFIYTSGVWVYGDTDGRSVREETVLDPTESVSWRPAVEKLVLETGEVYGIVLRPGVVYGKQGGLTGQWFKSGAENGPLKVVGDGSNRWAMIHVDDLARGYLQVVRKKVRRGIFNIVDTSSHTVMEMASAAACVAGNVRQLDFTPVDEALKDMGPLAQALALDQIVDASKAHEQLGWQPMHQGFIHDVDIYFRAWQASQR